MWVSVRLRVHYDAITGGHELRRLTISGGFLIVFV
jgi:hypothetical protein